jgi:hypothetical protein
MTQPETTRHLGDGVYATFVGYGIEIRVNDHRSDVAVFLEPSVLEALQRFFAQHQQAQEEQP